MTAGPIHCPYCKKTFVDVGAQYSHWKDRHRNRTMPAESKAFRAQKKIEREGDPSFADRAIEAQLDHAMGVHNLDYDWLVDPYT